MNLLSKLCLSIAILSRGFALPRTENKCVFSCSFFSVIRATNDLFYCSWVDIQ